MNQFVKTYLRARRFAKWERLQNHEFKSSIVTDLDKIIITPNYIGDIKNPSEDLQLAAVQRSGYAIQYIKNPSESIQIAAVQENGLAIGFIDNPLEPTQIAAVQQNGYAIEYIFKKGIVPSEDVQLAAVKENGDSIKFIDNPSEIVQLAAVQEDGWAIRYIENSSGRVQDVAVQQDPNVHTMLPKLEYK